MGEVFMIIEHELNQDLSKKVYELHKHKIKPKQCYNNVFHVVANLKEKFYNDTWKIAYGYMKLPNFKLMTRHCFIVNENNEAIDPTLYCLKSVKQYKEQKYISFAILDVHEYIDKIEQNNNYPALTKPLLDKEKLAIEWCLQNGIIPIG
jgi:hypothetical protein